MLKEEYQKLNGTDKIKSLVLASDLIDKSNRTLLYGYTCNRDTWHVYIEEGAIHTVWYKYKCKPEERYVADNYDYVPDKRLYPECCDYEFCKLIKEYGIDLPFTTWQDDRLVQQYYGETL